MSARDANDDEAEPPIEPEAEGPAEQPKKRRYEPPTIESFTLARHFQLASGCNPCLPNTCNPCGPCLPNPCQPAR